MAIAITEGISPPPRVRVHSANGIGCDGVFRGDDGRGESHLNLRPCESGGMHYQGDVREVAHLQHWSRAFFHPYCFQHHRWDKDCLPHKIRDGRTFWGSAAVSWCFSFPFADAVCVEQPDTITADFIDLGAVPGGAVREFTTDMCGDRERKLVRLYFLRAT